MHNFFLWTLQVVSLTAGRCVLLIALLFRIVSYSIISPICPPPLSLSFLFAYPHSLPHLRLSFLLLCPFLLLCRTVYDDMTLYKDINTSETEVMSRQFQAYTADTLGYDVHGLWTFNVIYHIQAAHAYKHINASFRHCSYSDYVELNKSQVHTHTCTHYHYYWCTSIHVLIHMVLCDNMIWLQHLHAHTFKNMQAVILTSVWRGDGRLLPTQHLHMWLWGRVW